VGSIRLMKTSLCFLIGCALALAGVHAAELEPGFVSLFDGKTLNGWKKANENEDAFRVENGAIVANGNRCHLYYMGDEQPFRNFELKVEVMTEPNSNSGIYFHTRYQENGWPRAGFECQVNVSQADWKKTGSLYDVVNLGWTPAQDGKWWTQHITVSDNRVTVRIDDVIVLEYTEPPGAQAGRAFGRKIGSGTFAFQAHDPGSKAHFKNIRVKRLDD
jgi:hypothetical protein